MADIAIFRINYKSDFILTLNSDAGWMTPFCIKFWTGAPSQAYFVGFDGTTYTHCAPVDGEPTKLRVQFDDHHLPIGDLKFQIAYHFTVADFPTSVEDEVLNQASVIIEVDDAPAQVMLDFNGETAAEIEFSLPAYANEEQRIANEAQRIANEQQRIANEESRIQAEETRQHNEQQRINQETARVNEFARLKRESEQATTDANAAATLANEKAQLAADKAALAQAAATLANEKAQLAADKAALAQAAATLANEKAALAQQKAEYAQTQGNYAKEQGDYAKEQGDYAKEQGDTALADHQRAETDHGIAVDDHTQAGNDHTRAESDHGIAVDDHTQAGSDHTRAESDHTQAGNDHTRAESDHATASADHTQAGNDHTRAESDHTRAERDHDAVELYVDSLGVFDLSKHNAVGGVLATYADLSAALTALNALDSQYKYGGMSFKFVQSSDNKYVQYILTKQTWSTYEGDWEKINLANEVKELDKASNNVINVLYGYTTSFATSGSVTNLSKKILKGAYIKSSTPSLGAFRLYQTLDGDYDTFNTNNLPIYIEKDYSFIQVYNAAGNASFEMIGVCDTLNESIEDLHVLQAAVSENTQNIDAIKNGIVTYAIKGTIATAYTFVSETYNIKAGNVIHNIGSIEITLYQNQSSSNYHVIKPGEIVKLEYAVTALKSTSQTGNFKLCIYEDDIVLDILNDVTNVKTRIVNLAELSLFNINAPTSVDSLNGYCYYGSRIQSGGGAYTYYLYHIEAGKYYQLKKNGQPENNTILAGYIKPENFHVGGFFSKTIFKGSDANGSITIYADSDSYIATLKLNSSTTGYAELAEYTKNSDAFGEIEEDIHELDERVSAIEENISIGVPEKIYAVVGDTLQLYYESIFDYPNVESLDVNVICDIGNKYPRYYEVTPVAADAGNHSITLQVRNGNGNIVSTKTVTLVVSSVSQPANTKNILCIGSSLTEGGQWAGELKRRLTGSGGTPAGLNFNNINFVGRKDLGDIKLEATGGYYLGSYLDTTDILYKFYFDASHPAPSGIQSGSRYECFRNETSVGTFEIKEFNINSGIGYITCAALTLTGTIYGTGTLTKLSGNGPDTLVYGSSGAVGNPFAHNGQIDIQQYADDYCNGQIDIVCLSELFLSQLTNSGTLFPYGKSFTAFFNDLTSFCNMFKAVFPNVKFIIGTMTLPDKRGGLGANFGAASNMRSEYCGYKRSAIAACLALNNYIETNNLANELYIMNWMNEMDNINDYIQIQKKVNPRSDVTEPFGNNGLHPSNIGYNQMADSAFRSFIVNLL